MRNLEYTASTTAQQYLGIIGLKKALEEEGDGVKINVVGENRADMLKKLQTLVNRLPEAFADNIDYQYDVNTRTGEITIRKLLGETK